MQEERGSNIDRIIGYFGWNSSWFFSVAPGECRDSNLDVSKTIPSRSLPSHHSWSLSHLIQYQTNNLTQFKLLFHFCLMCWQLRITNTGYSTVHHCWLWPLFFATSNWLIWHWQYWWRLIMSEEPDELTAAMSASRLRFQTPQRA
jgi:hypothetical protein